MIGTEEAKTSVPEVTQRDLDWINKRMDRLRKKINLIIAVLIDKKIIGDELGKRIVQESASDEELIDWLMNTLKKE